MGIASIQRAVLKQTGQRAAGARKRKRRASDSERVLASEAEAVPLMSPASGQSPGLKGVSLDQPQSEGSRHADHGIYKSPRRVARLNDRRVRIPNSATNS
eukprot:5027716-Prymnesium_polylepis.1